MTTTPSLIGLDEADERLVPLDGGKPAPLRRTVLLRAARRVAVGTVATGVVLVPLAGVAAAQPVAPVGPVVPPAVVTLPPKPPTPTHVVCIPCITGPKAPPVVVVTEDPTAPPTTPAPTTPAPTPATTPAHTTSNGTSTTRDPGTDEGDAAPLPPVVDPTDTADARGGAGGNADLATTGGSTDPDPNPDPLLVAGGGMLLAGGLGGLLWFATRRRAGR
ncbi:MAG TPA: hypothetical protein VLM05_18845 [Mycobacteriales bacterium]|nr:hypothetical protein [Mycobacteriales bacterium]